MTKTQTPASSCNICGKPANAPARRFDRSGRITEGCVDAFHMGHLVSPSASQAWHDRPEARRIRKALADSLPKTSRKRAA